MRFDSIVSILEDRKDLDIVTMYEIHRVDTAYKMRTKKEYPTRREITFKESKKTKGRKKYSSRNASYEYDLMEDNFMKKLQKVHGK